MATLLSPDMLPEDIRNMDFGQASMPHAPEAQTPEVPYDMTTSAPDRPAIPLSPDMLSGNLQGNGSEKSGIEFSFDASDTPSRSNSSGSPMRTGTLQ